MVKPKPSPLKQEPGSTCRADQTTFRSNFQPHDVKLCYTKSIQPPKPALINISSKISPVNVPETYNTATQMSFRNPKSLSLSTTLLVPELERSTFDKKRIYNTNFKMSVDDHFNGFSTTNSLAYPTTSQTGSNSKQLPKADLSVLKLSDPSLLGNTISYRTKPEYLDSFREFTNDNLRENTGCHDNQHHIDHLTVPSTDETEPFVTTAMDTFRANSVVKKTELPLSAHLQQKRITSIPLGDKNQVKITSSVFQDTYKAGNESSSQRTYDKESAHSVIHQSSIKLGDTQLIKVVKSSLLPLYVNPERQKPVLYERNASSFPTGDLNPDRVKERLSSFTMFEKPPHGSFPYHVDSSNLHTLSCVNLGHEEKHSIGQTIMKKSYNPSLPSLKVDRARAPLKDNIPFDYYKKLPKSTVQDSFRKIDQSTIDRPNKVALNNLSKSHWEFPNMDKFIYRTTHQNDFFLPPVT